MWANTVLVVARDVFCVGFEELQWLPWCRVNTGYLDDSIIALTVCIDLPDVGGAFKLILQIVCSSSTKTGVLFYLLLEV